MAEALYSGKDCWMLCHQKCLASLSVFHKSTNFEQYSRIIFRHKLKQKGLDIFLSKLPTIVGEKRAKNSPNSKWMSFWIAIVSSYSFHPSDSSSTQYGLYFSQMYGALDTNFTLTTRLSMLYPAFHHDLQIYVKLNSCPQSCFRRYHYEPSVFISAIVILLTILRMAWNRA